MQAQDYFQSFEDYFWEWESNSDGLYLVVPNAKTIAHSNLVYEILEYLSEESIPPFGSLLLAFIATNSEVGDSFDSILYYVRKKEVLIDGKSIPDISSAIEFLEKLKQLYGYKQGKKRLLLLKTIFSNCHKRISSEKADIILNDYKNSGVSIKKTKFNQASFTNDFKVFELLNKKFPTTSSILDALAGLPTKAIEDHLDEEIVDQNIISDKPKDLIEQLTEDDKTFHVGSLIKRIWSGLNIPLHHNMPSSQPLGGISDLTNKGDFDKLLLSEFAQEDDVFMSRLANNEALYIQREVPPEADQFERIILIDATLKNWGNAKVLNFATALAIAKHPKTDIDCKLFVLGTTFAEVLFSSVDEVAEGLNILNPTLDCSLGLQDFISANKKDSGSQELFFVTSEDSLRMEPIIKTISDYSDILKYIITTNPDGTIQIYKIQNKGRKYIQKIVLPLDELWIKKQSEKKKLVSNSKEKKEVVSYNYPILFSLPENPIATFYLNDKYYFINDNKSLQETYLDWNKNQNYHGNYGGNYINPACFRGCVILFENISIKSGGVYALGKNSVDEFEMIYYYEDVSRLCYLNINTKAFAAVDFGSKDKQKNCLLYYIDNNYILKNTKTNEFWKISYEYEVLNYQRYLDDKLGSEIQEYVSKLGKLYNLPRSNILKSFNKIGINEDASLQFNIHQLDLSRKDHVYLLTNSNSVSKIKAVRYKNKFVFPEGSEVIVDKKGIVTLISSDKSIPEFYIPTKLGFHIGMASNTEFTGNEYFYDEEKALAKVSLDEFKKKYINPFIKQIMNHGI
jgi:hypothetical protein